MYRFDATDHRHMARALELAARGRYTTHPNPRVGCVLVRGGRVVGEGWHSYAGEPHAEALALAQAGDRARGATAYVSLEPCAHRGRTPPCAQALIEAGVAEVVAAVGDPNPLVAGQGFERLRAAGINLRVGLLEQAATRLNAGFVSRMTRGRPWLRLKLAASLDGRTALPDGASQWITGTAARNDVQYLRAEADCVLSAVGTVLADDPGLNLRLSRSALGTEREPAQPLRVILDTELRTPPTARTLRLEGRVLVLGGEGASDRARGALGAAGAEVLLLPRAARGLDLHAVLAELARRQVNQVHAEAGPTLSGALLGADLVDELVLYLAPTLLGDASRGMFHLPGLVHMSQRAELSIEDCRRVGADLRITARPRARSETRD